MKMPFPGMDPYLEHPVLWPGLHVQLLVALANGLRPQIRPRYVVSIEERVFLAIADQPQVPDLWVQKARAGVGGAVRPGPKGSAPVIVEVEERRRKSKLQVRERYLEILDRYRDMQVVTTLELISPSNKKAGPGRREYLAKQRATLASEVHLVEIDLLRRGRHVLSVPKPYTQAASPYDYLACVNRSPERKRFELYGWQLRERLPTISVPLTSPDQDASLDLQDSFERVYEDADYELRVRYDEPCVPPLKPADQQWADERWAAYRAAHPDLFPPE